MREYKFRAWDWDGENGYAMSYSKDWSCLFNDGFKCKYSDGTVMQYTGLKDKNDVEIYEGDILHIIEDGNYGGEFYGKVEWLGIWAVYGIVLGTIKEIHKSFTNKNTTTIFTRGFLTRRYGSCIELSELIIDGLSYSKFSKREVIGNIYENPELLN